MTGALVEVIVGCDVAQATTRQQPMNLVDVIKVA
jgi:hypothetical protein